MIRPFCKSFTSIEQTKNSEKKEGGLEVEELITLIGEIGFPVVVTLFLLHRIEAKLDVVVNSIQSLPDRLKNS